MALGDGALAAAIAIYRVGPARTDGIVAVGGTTPAEIEVHQVIAIIAITYKGVTAFVGIARIIDGPADIEIVFQFLDPLGAGVVVFGLVVAAGFISKIGDHSIGNIGGIGA